MSDSPASFDRVLVDELNLIADRRGSARSVESEAKLDGSPASEKTIQASALSENLVGLAFSGGGIRSATFNLGVLQGLAALKLLRVFDFLSTVSGGGYIGSWFAAWIRREGNLDTVERLLNPDRVVQAGSSVVHDDEPDPIYHLRSYSNYLSARLGVFSADAWSLLSIYLRNFFLNQLIILPTLLAMVLVVHTTVYLFGDGTFYLLNLPAVWIAAAALTLLGIFIAFVLIGIAIHEVDVARHRPDAPFSIRTGKRLFLTWIFTPLCVASVFISCLLSYKIPGVTDLILGAETPDWRHLLSFVAFWSLAHGLAYPLARVLYSHTRLGSGQSNAGIPWRLWTGFYSGAAGGAMLYLLAVYLLQGDDLALAAMFGPPATMLIYILAAHLEVGLMCRSLPEDAREWWASLCGWLLMFASCWLAAFAVVLYGPLLCAWLSGETTRLLPLLGWAVTTLAGLLAGRSPRTGGERPNKVLEYIALIGPIVFFTGLLILLSALVQTAINFPTIPWPCLLALILVLAGVGFGFSTRVDVNLFSLHGLYANRLVRCYLGASQPKDKGNTDNPRGMALMRAGRKRQPNPITGFDFQDDLPLGSLRIGEPVKLPDDDKPKPPAGFYGGPHLLINTAMNLTQGDELAWQERKAESFVLTPLYCGSQTTGFRTVPDYADNILLGDAVTLSGAAVSPLMGYHSSPSVAALLTYFNVRLGGWLGNPHDDATWKRDGPRLGWFYLLKEMMGRSDQHSKYLYLSDGGHFENLGVYELVRRRCRYIVCSDADCDPSHTFENLANLIRKVRVDFGIRIDIDLTKLRLGAKCQTDWHCAVGEIHYEDVHPGAAPGMLLYLKASLTGDEPCDVRQYAEANPPFPHQSTLDQFFSESQFESYRALGEHVLKSVIGDALVEAHREADEADPHDRILRHPDRLFATIRRRWFAPPPEQDAHYLTSVDGCIEFEKMLRTDPNLRRFSREVYPEDSPAGAQPLPATADERRAEMHAVAEMLQVMENAWLMLRFDGYASHPLLRGWMSAFRRWTNAPTARRCWPVLRGEYSQGFVRFCESELGMAFRCDAVRVNPAAGDVAAALADLNEEFTREWPDVPTLPQRAENALCPPEKRLLAWLLTNRDRTRSGDWSASDYACGIILLHRADANADPELLVWLRGPYRNQRIGRACMEQVRDTIRQSLPGILKTGRKLCVQLPHAAETDRTSQLDRAMWLAFFRPYGFHRIDREPGHAAQGADLVLVAEPDKLFA